MGFPTPLRAWLMESRASGIFDYLQDGGGLLAAYVDHDALAELIGRHRSGQEDATDRIWRLLNLQIWGDLHITGRGMEAASSVTAAAAV
jgi:asparagine synthase (glutamine-hydrolysing)